MRPLTSPAALPTHHKDNPFPARLRENRPLNRPGSAKDTRHIVIDLAGSGLTYTPGDSVGIFPSQDPAVVDEVLGLLGCAGPEPVQLPKDTGPTPLREALSRRLDLTRPAPRALQVLLDKSTDAAERTLLEDLLRPEAKERTAAWLAQREFVDLLAEFPSARRRFTPQEFCDGLRKLAPRLYSIASSPRVTPHEVHTTLAVVRYVTNGRARGGICSTFVADRVPLGQPALPVFIAGSHFRLPADGARDIIMVGPGTGIAPFRAFVLQRAAEGATGRNWLFFGDQRRACDFLYEEEWMAALGDGRLARLDTAFSRDQAHKIYVQDRMREAGAELWRWLQSGAHLYVCGDAGRMARDVDAALHEVIATHGGLAPEAAAEHVKLLKKEKRYQRDVY